MLLLSPSQVRTRGLALRSVAVKETATDEQKEKLFRKEYGSGSLDIAEMWYDLMSTDIPESKLKGRHKTDNGFRMFMVAHHFLWTYPKNAQILANSFKICEKYARGKKLWRWIRLIAGLKAKKIIWSKHFASKDGPTFIITVDGTDFKVWEKKHATLPIDKGMYSQKFNHGAVKYEIAIDIHRSKIVWISGPHRGAMHDKTVYCQPNGLQSMIPEGKLVIADGGYKGTGAAVPNPKDPKPLRRFKSRCRLRQETLNGRLKKFAILYQTFRHSLDKHQSAFEAVSVIIQYQMDNGSELYEP